MSIDLKKCCGTHSKEKEDNGECCQLEDQKEAEQDKKKRKKLLDTLFMLQVFQIRCFLVL